MLLRGEVAAVVGAARFFAGQRAAGEHLGDEAEVFGVDRFVPQGIVDAELTIDAAMAFRVLERG